MRQNRILAVLIIMLLTMMIFIQTSPAIDTNIPFENRNDCIVLINESFENGFPPENWTNTGWQDSLYGEPYHGDHWAYSWAFGDVLTTPPLEFGVNTTLTFWYRAESSTHPMDSEVYVNDTLVWYDYGYTHDYYVMATVNLDSFSGLKTIAFHGHLTGDFYGTLLDLITVTTFPFMYVDDDYNSSTPGWQSTHFDVIQDGIDAVAENGTVYVNNGTYFENIIVNKSVIINGEDNSGTIINGNDINNTIIIAKDNVCINNFKITNGTNIHSYKSAGILINSNYNQIINCNISNNNHIGITINHSSYNNITGNYFYNNQDHNGNSRGIFIHHSPNNIISNNTVYSNTSYSNGIGLYYSSSINNIVCNNSLLGTNGIWINYAPLNFIYNNSFEKNGVYISGPLSSWNSQTIHDNFVNNKPIYYYKNSDNLQVQFDAGQVILANCHNFTIKNLQLSNMCNGLALGFSTNNLIDNNTIESSLYNGINLWGSTNNSIINNSIISSRLGIRIWQSTSYTLIKNNFISANSYEGISLRGNTHHSLIINNVIINNSRGILMDATSNNTIKDNIIQNNQYYGIYIFIANGPCDNNLIYHNNFINNFLNAFDEGNGTWDNGYPSGGNYYGDYTGVDTNGDGIGETPYLIDGGSNLDNYPFTDPYGWLIELDVNQSTQDRGFPIRHAADGDWAGAQNVTPTFDYLTKCEIYLRKFGTPEFNLTVDLREDHPQGTLIDSIVFTQENVSSSWTWLNLNFDDIKVNASKDYFIVCPPAQSGVTTSFGYEWGYAFGDQYPDGAFWFTRDGGSLWRDLPTMYEFVFKTYGYDL